MNGRFVFGIVLLLVLFFAGLGAWFGTVALHQPIQQALDDAAEAVVAKEWEAAVVLADQALNRWKIFRSFIASISDHTPMDEIDSLFACVCTYAKLEQEKEFAASCAQLAQQIQAMADAHRLTWWNFL